MSAKIKLNIFNTLFHLFSFLADKTNGWMIFVKPKLLFGSLIMGLSVSVYSAENEQNNVSTKCYESVTPSEKIVTQEEVVIRSCYAIQRKLPLVEDSMKVYDFVKEPPAFPGGDKARIEFINKELRYPITSCYESSITGTVYCSFIIEKDGTISNIEVVRGVDPILNKEVVRVIECMPRWIPGKQNGKPVRTRFTLPIRFSLR